VPSSQARKLLRNWIKAWKAHGPEGLNRKRGPKPGPRRLKPIPADDKKGSVLTADDKKGSVLTQANARIAELERLVGRQQLDSDDTEDGRLQASTCSTYAGS